MSRYSLRHLSDSALLHELKTLVAQDRATTALLVAHLGEVDARRLYAPQGYPSMYDYCVRELRFSEDTAFKRIRAARAARQFPTILPMLTDGRLHVSAVVMLTPHLTPDNADDLLAAAAHRSKAQIEQMLAERFPQPDLVTLVTPVAPPMSLPGVAPGPVDFSPAKLSAPTPAAVAPVPVAPAPQPLAPPAKLAPLAPERFAIQCTVDKATYELIRHAQELLGHSVPNGDLPEAIHRAFAALVAQLERQKFAKTERPRPCHRSENARQIPASVKRAVWERDGGRCTFVGENGRRCESCTRLEYDHVTPVATGGHATASGLRLRCRAHNQLEAERAFGRDFMSTKREASARPAAVACAPAAVTASCAP
jgi:5-methylcytosine-specific restriction endonuclease McrA